MARFSYFLKLLIVSLFISCIFFTGCKSSKIIPIPGEYGIILQNLYVEYSNIADTYYKLEDYQNAIKYYDMAMQDKDLYWSCYYKKAKCYVVSSNWNEALPMYEKILKRDPENLTIKESIAYIYIMQGDLQQAENIYKELLLTEPDNYSYTENYLAVLLIDEETYKKNIDKVNELFDYLKTNFPDNTNLNSFTSTIERYAPKDEDTEPENENKNFSENLDSEGLGTETNEKK